MQDELHLLEMYKQLNPNELSYQDFSILEHEIQKPHKDVISDYYLDFKLWYMGAPSRQESFANFLSKRLSKHTGAKILEVGGGRTGRLSRFLSKNGFAMTCIDPKLEMSDTNNICFLKQKFNLQFDLTGFDYVVAQEPCEATEHIVRACVNQHVPFLISLCGVPHKLLSGITPKNSQEWYDYLVNISNQEIKLRYIQLDHITSTPILKSNSF